MVEKLFLENLENSVNKILEEKQIEGKVAIYSRGTELKDEKELGERLSIFFKEKNCEMFLSRDMKNKDVYKISLIIVQQIELLIGEKKE